MKYYADSNIVIYFVENPPQWGPLARTRLSTWRNDGHLIVVSDLTRMEARVRPLRSGNAAVLQQFEMFFADPDVLVVPVTGGVFDRAADIRAKHNFKALDAIHLAAAADSGCDGFLTHDARLSRFPDLTVEILS